ncbi:DNA-binding transcriptional regulator, LacI/PurR family [Chitinasiproducens palmae]|uniref:DNA-binding transcriptional regulator, LacI/PurR family n=2 Tax=Chitinasiproducens palmae TaxID=1770053 RepID=A0A1H2PKH1_9BURK|nr:DNA-binding transcriptional regulator, LacI/PurR family [Chitinasiproducens palmae]
MAAATQLGYRPNQIARSLITRRSNIIGVAMPNTGNPFYRNALNALSVEFARIGYRILLFTSDPVAGSDPILAEVLRYQVDAVVLISTSLSSHFAEECMQIGVPVVLLNRRTDSAAVSSVTGDNTRGARAIAAFLLAGGHRRFAYVAGLETSSTNRDREAAFFAALAQAGVDGVERQSGHYTAEGAAQAARVLLARRSRPDAIFCANDDMAFAVMNVARAEYGLDIGKTLSIVGFDDTDLAAWPMLDLTSYAQPVQPMVAHVLESIVAQLEGGVQATHHVVRGELIVRRSARRPSSGVERLDDGREIWRASD